MRYLLIILGLISIYGGCAKSVSINLDASKSFSTNGKIIKCHWWQVSGPSKVTFDNPNAIVTTVTGNKPVQGVYVIGGYVIDEYGIKSDTTLSYILPQLKVGN